MLCESCNKEHDGSYGSGRFCSCKCSRGFSTKAKRADINERVKLKLKTKADNGEKFGFITPNPEYSLRDFICPTCGKVFQYKEHSRVTIKYCSAKCVKHIVTKETKDKLSKARIISMEAGIINGYGIHCKFPFNNDYIRCDSKLEYFALLNFCKDHKVESISRVLLNLDYVNCHGDNSKYIPDFYIKAEGKDYIIEVKSSNIAPFLGKRWKDYQDNGKLKKKILEDYANDNDCEFVWITNKTYKNYNTFKVPIDHLKT